MPRKPSNGNASQPKSVPVRLQRDILLDLNTPPDSMDELSPSEAGSTAAGPATNSPGVAPSVNGSTASHSTASSRPRGGRRRRNRNGNGNRNRAHIGDVNISGDHINGGSLKNRQAGGAAADQKPVRLQISLNLNVELELKAKLEGDVCLSLVAENMKHPHQNPEKIESGEAPDEDGNIDNELFRMHVGDLTLKQDWVQQVSPSLTAAVMLGIALGGFVLGMLASQAMGVFPRLLCPGPATV